MANNLTINPDLDPDQETLLKDQLNCSQCHELLCIPVILVDGIGNVCQKCFEAIEGKRKDELKFIPNDFMNALLKTLNLPCKFQSAGCQSVLTYDGKCIHEKVCIYQSLACLLSKSTSCDWNGSILHFIDHFIEKHKSGIVYLDEESNKFNFQLIIPACNNPFVKLLINQNIHLFFIAYVEDDKMFYTVFEGINNDQPPYEHVKISHIGPNGKFNVKCEVRTLKEYIKCRVADFEMSLSHLTYLTVEEGIVELQIKELSNNISIVSKKISHHFECPVCNKLMFSTIYMCKTGHSFCGQCKSELKACPICRCAIENSRNFTLENISADVLYPCEYKCGEYCLGNELQDHMKYCVFKTFTCPLDDFCGNYDTIKKHYRATHTKMCCFSNTYTAKITLKDEITPKHIYVFYEDTMFVITYCNANKKIKWIVHCINCAQKNKYMYEISIINILDESHKLTMASYCQESECLKPNKSLGLDQDCMLFLRHEILKEYVNLFDEIKVCCVIKN